MKGREGGNVHLEINAMRKRISRIARRGGRDVANSGRQTFPFGRVLISQTLISFCGKHTVRLALSSRTFARPLLRPAGRFVLTPDDKMTKGWSPRASDITVSVSELCDLSTPSRPAYPARKRLVIDYAQRTFGSFHPPRIAIDGEAAKGTATSANDRDVVSTSFMEKRGTMFRSCAKICGPNEADPTAPPYQHLDNKCSTNGD